MTICNAEKYTIPFHHYSRPWTNEDDIMLLEAVKKYGIKNWSAIASEFNDESRNRTRCRHRFEAIYRLFENNPSIGLDSMIDLDTNKVAAKRRAAAYSSFDKKFESWAQRMNMEPVLTTIPVQQASIYSGTKLFYKSYLVVLSVILFMKFICGYLKCYYKCCYKHKHRKAWKKTDKGQLERDRYRIENIPCEGF